VRVSCCGVMQQTLCKICIMLMQNKQLQLV
jgi:hypothetical protein